MRKIFGQPFPADQRVRMPLLPSQITLISASRIIRSTGTGTSPWRRSESGVSNARPP